MNHVVINVRVEMIDNGYLVHHMVHPTASDPMASRPSPTMYAADLMEAGQIAAGMIENMEGECEAKVEAHTEGTILSQDKVKRAFEGMTAAYKTSLHTSDPRSDITDPPF